MKLRNCTLKFRFPLLREISLTILCVFGGLAEAEDPEVLVIGCPPIFDYSIGIMRDPFSIPEPTKTNLPKTFLDKYFPGEIYDVSKSLNSFSFNETDEDLKLEFAWFCERRHLLIVSAKEADLELIEELVSTFRWNQLVTLTLHSQLIPVRKNDPENKEETPPFLEWKTPVMSGDLAKTELSGNGYSIKCEISPVFGTDKKTVDLAGEISGEYLGRKFSATFTGSGEVEKKFYGLELEPTEKDAGVKFAIIPTLLKFGEVEEVFPPEQIKKELTKLLPDLKLKTERLKRPQ